MTYYLAAPFVHRQAAINARAYLATKGYTCVSRWLDTHLEDNIGPEAARKEAYEDLRDIQKADLFILLNNYPTSVGRAIETGYALAQGMHIYCVGPPTSLFHHLPAVTCVDYLADIPSVLDKEDR